MFYIKQELPINGQIRAKDVQLISENGEKLGIVPLARALELATEKKLDLVLVSPNSQVPVCKIMNYGKYKFEQAKKEKEAKKKQRVQETKELRITPNIEEHDFSFNVVHVVESGIFGRIINDFVNFGGVYKYGNYKYGNGRFIQIKERR